MLVSMLAMMLAVRYEDRKLEGVHERHNVISWHTTMATHRKGWRKGRVKRRVEGW